jgi:hypothetical protein
VLGRELREDRVATEAKRLFERAAERGRTPLGRRQVSALHSALSAADTHVGGRQHRRPFEQRDCRDELEETRRRRHRFRDRMPRLSAPPILLPSEDAARGGVNRHDATDDRSCRCEQLPRGALEVRVQGRCRRRSPVDRTVRRQGRRGRVAGRRQARMEGNQAGPEQSRGARVPLRDGRQHAPCYAVGR